MKKLPLFIAIVLLFACTNKNDELREKIEPVLREFAITNSLVASVDSIQIYKISNLSDFRIAKRTYINAIPKIRYYSDMANGYKTQAEADSILSSMSSDEALANKTANWEKERSYARKYADSANELFKKTKMLIKQLTSGKLDSTNFKGYVVVFKVVGADAKNKEIKNDSLQVYISPTYHIIRSNSF